jgi:hypothetical protein
MKKPCHYAQLLQQFKSLLDSTRKLETV